MASYILGYRQVVRNIHLHKFNEVNTLHRKCFMRNLSSFPEDWLSKGTLYFHWPYCAKRCSYCNFNKYIKGNVDHDKMKECLVKESQTLLGISHIKQVTSIFFGGGTPSLALPSTIESVINAVTSIVHVPSDAEITIEVNPTSLESDRLSEFKQAGINRVSIGVQSLNDNELLILGREHSAKDSLRCLEIAKKLFPSRTSVDVMFGIPFQTIDSFKQQLEKILQVCDDHISLYQLTLERGTSLFKKVMDRELTIANPELMAEMYECAVETLEKDGIMRYEASNFARNGTQSKHNMAYWKGSQYIGVGPGAHGRFVPIESESREARIQTLEPDPWMYEVHKYGHATRKIVQLTHQQVLEEILMLGLRTKTGITNEHWNIFSPNSLANIYEETYICKMLQDEEYLTIDKGGIRCTNKGLNVVDSIVPELINVMEKYFEINS